MRSTRKGYAADSAAHPQGTISALSAAAARRLRSERRPAGPPYWKYPPGEQDLGASAPECSMQRGNLQGCGIEPPRRAEGGIRGEGVLAKYAELRFRQVLRKLRPLPCSSFPQRASGPPGTPVLPGRRGSEPQATHAPQSMSAPWAPLIGSNPRGNETWECQRRNITRRGK